MVVPIEGGRVGGPSCWIPAGFSDNRSLVLLADGSMTALGSIAPVSASFYDAGRPLHNGHVSKTTEASELYME